MTSKFYVKELVVPTGALIDVTTVLLDSELTNEIVGCDEDDHTITLEVSYNKEERDAVVEIERILEDYEDEEDE
ncbi:hypothetical protein [Dinghuibacter silviterrae]|uniref:Uncharacterized protein n=1 Tax=Dinghuibacter silviterrae TaxID=1539049 RepID=A0A4R8DI44_9BACT|nr:hypothetical protein [Dinghuibacter silviterrae]TDW97148.1 hypothetical protein EDB95_4990 [Dinghuibacter silviterrae]